MIKKWSKIKTEKWVLHTYNSTITLHVIRDEVTVHACTVQVPISFSYRSSVIFTAVRYADKV